MIPRNYITEWRKYAPWQTNDQVEQDLVISRALVEIYNNIDLADTFAFRGGTALTKLYMPTAARYSEDIDLVQIKSAPIGRAIDVLRSVLDPWLGKPQRNHKKGTINLIYQFDSDDAVPIPLRLKVEINSREHFSVFELVKHNYSMESRWHSGTATITTYALDELLGTKLRALYQRKKGRDLFDLWAGLTVGEASPQRIVEAFSGYIKFQKLHISNKEFTGNLAAKMEDRDFVHDTDGLIHDSIKYNVINASALINEKLIALID